MSLPIQDPGIGTLLARAFNLKGRVRPSLEEFIVPTVSVGDLSKGYPPPVRRSASAGFTQGAVAAEHAVWRLEVPGSVIATIDSISLNSTADTNIEAFFGSSFAVTPTSIAPKSFTDGRLLQVNELAAGVLVFDTQIPVLATAHWRLFVGATNPRRIEPLGWVVGSGIADQFGFVEFLSTSVNVVVVANIEWTEYSIV